MNINFLKVHSWLFLMVIVTSPMTSWFAISTYLRLPALLLLVLFISTIPFYYSGKYKISKKYFTIEDGLLLLWLVSFFASAMWNSEDIQNKFLTNIISIAIVVFGFNFYLKVQLFNLEITKNKIYSTFRWTLLILYAIILVEFVLTNFYSTSLLPIFSWAGVYNSEGYYRLWFSSSSPSEEPGNVAFFINIFWFLAVIPVIEKRNYFELVWLFLIQLLCLVLLVSTAGIFFFILTILVLLLIKKRWKTFIGILFFILSAFLFFIYSYSLYDEHIMDVIFHEIIPKMMLDGDYSKSANVRTIMWSNAFSDWYDAPIFGNGPGYNRIKYDSTYYGIFTSSLANCGILGFASIFLFFLSLVIRTLKARSFNSLILFGVLIIIVSKNSISDSFLHLPMWIAINYLLFELVGNNNKRA